MQIRIAVALAVTLCGAGMAQETQDWTHYVRIAGHGVRLDAIGQTIKSAKDSNVFGMEVDNDIPGRYESFLDPTEKLTALRAMAKAVHEAGNYAFVYVVGTECITGNAATKTHTMAKDHPDWLQRNLKGEPALFTGGAAFWIRGGDEDVWVTPYAPEWRKIYMERIRQIAETGIDGIYVDVPYWMTHFDGWRDTWLSFDDYTVAAFRKKTGLNARTDLKLGDYRDANFRKWIDFRLETYTDFMREVNATAKAVNPKCKTIAEIYPGIEEDALHFGTDVYELYPVVDTIAHEYTTAGRRKPIAGAIPTSSASRTPVAWFQDMVGMYSFRAFAGSKPTWMLTYAWDGEKAVPPAEGIENLAMAQLMAGTNTWDNRGHSMGGSNDMQTRKVVFAWIRDHEKTFYQPRTPVKPIGVYFSPKSRNYFPQDFIDSYRGAMLTVLQSHLEFEIVTPRTLANFQGDALILPDARCLSQQEIQELSAYAKPGRTLIVTGQSGKYDETGAERPSNPLHKLLGITDGNRKKVVTSGKKLIYDPQDPGRQFYLKMLEQFDQSDAAGTWAQAEFNKMRAAWVGEILKVSAFKPAVEVTASPFVTTQIANVEGKQSIFLANFKGLKAKENAQQIPEAKVKVTFNAAKPGVIYFLPFMGEVQKLTGVFANGKLTAELPDIQRGAAVWMEAGQ
jgi:hypothetical protein